MTTDVLGRRVVAAIVDLVVLSALFVLLGSLLGEAEAGGGSVRVGLEGAAFVLFVVLSFAYYGVAEALTGRTLGKRLLGLRVLADDGQTRPAAGKIFVRTLLRIVDGIAFYAVALAVALATGERRQRIGDLAAGTVVVGERR